MSWISALFVVLFKLCHLLYYSTGDKQSKAGQGYPTGLSRKKLLQMGLLFCPWKGSMKASGDPDFRVYEGQEWTLNPLKQNLYICLFLICRKAQDTENLTFTHETLLSIASGAQKCKWVL